MSDEKISFLELMEGTSKYFTIDTYYICNCALKYLAEKKPELATMCNNAQYDYLSKKCPEFIEWIMTEGEQLYKMQGLKCAYILGGSWCTNWEVKKKIFDKKLEELRKETLQNG